jgi:hypothetical protein
MSRRLDRLREAGVHFLLGLAIIGVVMVMATDWSGYDPGAARAEPEELGHPESCGVCKFYKIERGEVSSRANDDMVAVEERSAAWEAEEYGARSRGFQTCGWDRPCGR